jgi:hypothetical protein
MLGAGQSRFHFFLGGAADGIKPAALMGLRERRPPLDAADLCSAPCGGNVSFKLSNGHAVVGTAGSLRKSNSLPEGGRRDASYRNRNCALVGRLTAYLLRIPD